MVLGGQFVKITEGLLRELIEEEKFTLTEVANILRVSTGWISRLCKRYGIAAPSPGRVPGYSQPEAVKEKISKTILKRNEEEVE